MVKISEKLVTTINLWHGGSHLESCIIGNTHRDSEMLHVQDFVTKASWIKVSTKSKGKQQEFFLHRIIFNIYMS